MVSLVLDRYDAKMKREILAAQDVDMSTHPCTRPFLPRNKTGIFRMFLAYETKSDEYNSFYVMQLVSVVTFFM
ncbi:putative O-linked-mannose beta-1-2-N-acetylglucosaminyltransferase 1-like 3, partial [Homarus americanus]